VAWREAVSDGLADESIRALLLATRRIALVGASDRPERPSFGVAAFLVARGYAVTPVNPLLAGRALPGGAAVGTLAAAAPLELVDIFRRSEQAGAVVDEAIALGARAVWMQLGVADAAAAARARAAGLVAVMDRCPVIEWHRLGLPAKLA
jgi:predicted CoA-binding protein